MNRPLDRICFIYTTGRKRHDDWANRHNLSYVDDRMWHIATVAVNSRLEKLIACIPVAESCPVSTKRWVMHKHGGQDTQQFFVEYSNIDQVGLPHGLFCPHCLEMAERAAIMLATERNETVSETQGPLPDPEFAADRPFVVDSANSRIYYDKEKKTIVAAKELATKLVQQYDRPFAVCVPHTTLAPKARPVKETKHKFAK